MNLPLSVSHISKQFGNSEILAEVSFDLPENAITSIVGESGCGKTTLLRIIAGHEQADSGSITIHGVDHTHSSAQKRNIGLVFQEYALFPHLTVKKNITFALDCKGKQANHRVQELLELIGLPDKLNQYPHELSGGQQQRIAIARALASSPSLLLMDEPFSNLDPIKRKTIRESILKITKDAETSCLIVTHDIRDAIEISDHIIILRNGKIIQQGTPDHIVTSPHDDYVKALIE